MPTTKILVPVDGSDFSRQILPHICKVYAPEDTLIYLLRVGDLPHSYAGMPPRPVAVEMMGSTFYENTNDLTRATHPIYTDQEQESLESELQATIQSDIRMLKSAGYKVISEIRFGDPGEEIVGFASEKKVDMVAMTTHGRTGLMRLLFGSVAEKILRTLTIPILILRPS